jgi:predicted SAM-dependent methyltransferase
MWLKSVLKQALHALPRGLEFAALNMRNEIIIWKHHRSGCRRARTLYTARGGLKLNVGCGPNYKEGWVNIDLSGHVELTLDMRQPIPLPDRCASIIYSEHFFEHLDYPHDALLFLSESYRILERGGIFSVGVPDTKWPLMDYAGRGDGKYLEAVEAHHWHPEWAKTFLDHINYHFRQDGEHRYAYDFETLSLALESVGFTDIKQRDFDSRLDTEWRRVGTLYVDAIKNS